MNFFGGVPRRLKLTFNGQLSCLVQTVALMLKVIQDAEDRLGTIKNTPNVKAGKPEREERRLAILVWC